MLLNLALEEVLYEKFPSGEKKKTKQKLTPQGISMFLSDNKGYHSFLTIRTM